MGSGSREAVHRRRWYILGVLVFSLLVVVLDNTVLNVALKTIADPQDGLGATQGELAWSINSYALVFAGMLFTFGVIGDRLGRKRVLIVGMVLFALASALSAYAQTPSQLIWARAFMGVGGAAIMPQTLSIITNVFEPHERAKAIGVWTASIGLAIAIGPVTGGVLLAHFWWGSVFLINVPIVAAGVIAMTILVPESRDPSPGRLDPVGVTLSIVGLVALSYGIIEGGERASWLDPMVLGSIVAGLGALVFFVWYEARITHPAFDVRLFRDPRLSAGVGVMAFGFFAVAGVIFFINFYMQSVRGLAPVQAGAMVLPFAAAQLLFAPHTATLERWLGARTVCTVGMLLMTAAMLGYQLMDQTRPLWVLMLIFFVQGTSMAIVMPSATEAIMSALPREKAGGGSAVLNTARQVAIALGVAVLGSAGSVLYRGALSPELAVLPAGPRQEAGESITGTMAVAEQLGPAGQALVEPANAAFVDAMHIASLASAAAALLGALVVFGWMPRRQALGGANATREGREGREGTAAGEPEPARV